MPLFGKIIVIKRNGTDGIHFPLTASSCLFGRKTECDIRIQLPQVSKEHCKIEVNENKEAILFNLSTLNPTHLNGNSFQQPAHLKHGDVFTIVDRSFRFEYPPQSTPRKRLSRTPKNETLQQVSEVELQSPRSKSPHTSDKNIECESQNFGENDKQSTEEDISRVVPAKHHATPKSAYKTAKSNRRENEMSPFSKLYELLKHEIDEKTQKDGNEKILIPQLAETNAPKNSLLTCSSGQEIQTNEKEIIIGENIEQSKIKEQEQNNAELNHTFAEENGSKSFSGSLQTSVSKDKPRDNQDAGHLHLQDSTSTKEHRNSENSEGVKKIKYVTTKLKMESYQSETCSPNTYRMESLECIDKICQAGKPVEQTANVTNKASLTDTSKADKYAVSTPRYKRKSLLAHSSPSMKSNESSATNSSSPLTGQDPSLGMKAAEISTEIQKKDVACSSVAGNESYVLGENKYSKQKRNSKQLIPRKSLNAEEVLKEIYDDTYSVSITTETDSETVALSPGHNSKSPKGSVRQSKRFSNKSPFSEVFTPERLTPKDESSTTHKYHSEARRGRRTSSGKMSEKILERDQSQKHDKNANIKDSSVKEKLATENYQQKLDVEDANVVLEPPRLSSKRRCSESVALLRDDEVASEINISSLLTEDKKSGQIKRSPRKRKSGELEILLQPIEKRKRVSFGGHLSPELFDKSLPPNSPLKRGAIPARLSLPFGNSPRAVLKKAQGFKRLVIKDLTEQLQRGKSQENLPARRSPAASPPARRSPAASPPARRSPAASPPSLKKMSPNPVANSSSTIPFTKGRFSISHISTPSPTSKKQGTAATELNENERVNFTGVRTPESFHINQELQVSVATTPKQLRRRSIRFSAKRTPMKKRSDAVETIHSKRRSGASKANLLVAKSWAEVVKLGVARPQVKAVKKCVLKGRSAKKLTKSPKTPARKIKGHFSTGHADSPATIVIGKAHTSAVKLVGQAPRVVKNYALKQNMDINESFTGMTEMFRTPVNENKKSPSLSAAHKTDLTPSCTEIEVSEVHTPEETGEMVISPLSTSGMSQQRKNSQDAVSRFLRVEKSPNSSFVGVTLKQTPEKERTVLEEEVEMSDSLVMPEKHITEVGAKGFEKTPKQKPESDEAFSGVKRLLRTPKQKAEPIEALSGFKRLLRTPKQKAEPVEALSGIKRLMRTPKQKVEPVESLSGVKRLLRTPKQKAEPVEALSGIKRLMRTPKQKVEPVESLSGIKRLLRTPKEKAELVETLSGVKRLLSTPEQKKESLIDEITVKRLLKTPAQKEQALNDLVGLSFMKTTQKQKYQPVEDMIGVSHIMKTSKQKIQLENTVGIKRLLKTSKERVEPVEDMFGISRLLRTPKEKYPPVDDFMGLQKLMAEPKQKYSSSELDYVGVKEMFDTPKEIKVKVMDFMKENNSHIDPKNEHESIGNLEREKLKQEKRLEESLEKTSLPFIRSRNRNIKNEQELQGNFEKACISPKVLEIVKNIDSIEKENMSDGSNTESHNLLNSVILLTKTDPVQEPAMQLQKELNQYLKGSDNEEFLFKNPVTPQLNLIQESIDLSSKDKTSTKVKQQKIEIKECPSSYLRECEENLKENVSLLELPVLMKESIEEQKEEVVAFTSVVKNLERKESNSPCMEEDISKICVLQQLDKNDAVSSVEINRTLHSSRRSKGNLGSCNEDSLMPKTETTTMKQNLQTMQQSVTSHILIMENDQSIKIANVSNSNKNVIGLVTPEEKSDQGSVENSEKVALSIRKRSGRDNKLEIVESLVPAKRTRRGKIEDNTEMSTEDYDAKEKFRRPATRNHCRAETAKCIKTREQDCAKRIIETAAVEESEINKLTLETMMTEKKGRKPLRVKSRKQLEETNNENAEMGPENVRNVQETKKTSNETVFKTHNSIKNETQAALGNKEAEGGQSLKESYFENTNEAPINVYSLQINTNSIKKPNQLHENKKGKKDLLVINESEFAKNEELVPQIISETEPETDSTKDTSGSLQVGKNYKTKEAQNSPTAAMICDPKDDERTVLRRGKRIRKGDGKQEALETKQIEILENTPTVAHGTTLRREREKKVHFELDQNKTSENIPFQANGNHLRRGRRKEVYLTSQVISSTSLRKKYSLLEIDAKKETPKKDKAAASEYTVSPTKENPVRRGRRKQVDNKVLATSSTFFGGKCSLLEYSGKEEVSKDHNVPLETIVLPTKEKLSRRGKRNEVSLTARGTSLRGESSLPENDGKEDIPEEDQNVLLGNTAKTKATPSRKSRRKQVDLTIQATSCTSLRGKSSLPENDKEVIPKEQNMFLGNTTSQEKANLSRNSRRKQVDLTAQGASSTTLRGKSSLPENNGKKEIPEDDQNVLLGNTAKTKATQSRKSQRKQVNLTTQATSCPFLRGKRSLPENKEVISKDQNMSLGSTASQEKANLSRNSRRKQVDLTAQGASSTSLRGKSSLPENNGKEEIPEDDQNVLLGNTAEIKATPSRKSRRKQVDLTTQATSCTSLRGKRSLPENDDKGKVPAENQNVPFKNITKTQANPSRKGRRKQVDLTTQVTSCTSLREESSLPENDGKEDIPEEDQNVLLGNTAETKATPSRKSRRKQVDLTTQATSCTSPRGKNCLPEKNDEEKTLKDENMSFGNATETKTNLFSKGRRKQVGLTTQAASCTSLKGKSLPEKDGKEKTPKEDQNMPLGNITSQASKKGGRKQLDLTTQAASPTALEEKSCMPKNDSKKKTSKEDQNVPLASTTLETKANPSRKGRRKQVELTSQAASSTSLRRKRHLPEDEETAKKLKAECGERITLQKETRNKSNRKLDKCGLNIQSVGGTERKTRASTRTRK